MGFDDFPGSLSCTPPTNTPDFFISHLPYHSETTKGPVKRLRSKLKQQKPRATNKIIAIVLWAFRGAHNPPMQPRYNQLEIRPLKGLIWMMVANNPAQWGLSSWGGGGIRSGGLPWDFHDITSKTKMANGTSPFLIGDASSNGCFPLSC